MKTCIIFCPKHTGLKSNHKRWNKIANVLEQYEIAYDFIQSESAQSVERIVMMMIGNGYDNIIICGGDSALCDTVNCLMKIEKEKRDKIAIGVIPNGVMNDFASFWGFSEKDIGNTVESLKERRIRKVDVGCMTYTDNEQAKKTRYFLNCVNIGLIALTQRIKRETRKILWSRKVSFVVSLFLLIFHRTFWKMQYTINYVEEKHRVMTLCIGSCTGYGQTPNAVPYNGMLDTTVIKHSALTHLLGGIYLFVTSKILNYKDAMSYRSRNITLNLQKNVPMSIDGKVMNDIDTSKEIKMWVEQECINFIIEK